MDLAGLSGLNTTLNVKFYLLLRIVHHVLRCILIFFFLQYDWGSRSGLSPETRAKYISLGAAARGLRWKFQQLWLQRRIAISGLRVHQVQWRPRDRGCLSLHRKGRNLQIHGTKCCSPTFRLCQHHSCKITLRMFSDFF